MKNRCSPEILETPNVDGDASAGEPHAASLHRIRFIAPLQCGRDVVDLCAIPSGEPASSADLLLHLDPLSPQEAAASLERYVPRLRKSGIVVLAVKGGPEDELRRAITERFRHHACYIQRIVFGSVFLEARYAASRIAPLASDPATQPLIHLHLCSDAALPILAGCVFEANPGDGLPARLPASPAPAAPASVPEADAVEMRERAASLITRLLEVEQETLALRQQAAGPHRQSVTDLRQDGTFFDPPRTRHSWPFAEYPGRLPSTLDWYDHRVDDCVILEARAGEAFRDRFGFSHTSPDFTEAVASLNTKAPALMLCPDTAGAAPDVSVIVPIHGQLAWTLNCLDSLLAHRSRYNVEIIVIDDASPDDSGMIVPLVAGIRYHRQLTNAGFIASCNHGARLARGRILVMLNNDTRVVAGWLDTLVESFDLFPQAGLVGSKMLYPDGTLQEAGGIIWRDGSAWNYGRNDDPNRPQYAYAREVDYVSGCSMAVSAALWRQFGGFDPLYAPAYCEDADLCLRLRQRGYQVWFQPQSRVIHYEGRTSGTDTSRGVKAYQVANAKKLFLRWRDTLASHRPNGVASFLERERYVRKRALIVDATAPTPKQDAGSVTTTQTLRLFRQLGYKPHFAAQDNFLFQPIFTTDLQKEGIDCAYAPYDANFSEYISRYGWMFDVVLVYRVTILERVLEDLRRHAPQAPILFHNMDLHFLRMQREAEIEGSVTALRTAERMKAKEIDLIRRVDCTITHSTFERDLLARETPDAPVIVWPFMFDFHGTDVGFHNRQDFVFLGGYRHPPNVDAVKFFVEDVFPRIKRKERQARFIIAGANPGPEIQALARKDVIVTGMVDDLRDVFDSARVFACSLRIGAGTKGKISTAMAYGLPVVSTTCGAEGMELVDGEDVLLADDPAAFAEACLRLYHDETLWHRLSESGQRLVCEKHSLDMGRRVLDQAIEVALAHKLGITPDERIALRETADPVT
jgi:GT2 family glycosyltransferase/glycosyltransferase involved in cell wall biosynthesis